MKKTAMIWRFSIYKDAIKDKIFRCNKCKATLYDANTGLFSADIATHFNGKRWIYCHDCGNVCGRIEFDIEDNSDGYLRGEWNE